MPGCTPGSGAAAPLLHPPQTLGSHHCQHEGNVRRRLVGHGHQTLGPVTAVPDATGRLRPAGGGATLKTHFDGRFDEMKERLDRMDRRMEKGFEDVAAEIRELRALLQQTGQ